VNTSKYVRALEKHRRETHSWLVISGMVRIYSSTKIEPQLMCNECQQIIIVEEPKEPEDKPEGNEPQ